MNGDGGSRLPARLSRAIAGAALAIFLPAAGPSALTLESASPLQGTATLFHPYPFARVDNAVAAVVNPAGLGVRYGSDLYGMITDSDNLRDGDFAVLVKLRRLGLSYEQYRPIEGSESVGRLTVAAGRPIMSWLYLGSSFAWYFSDDGELADLSSLDIGLLARHPFGLSVGAAATGINKPEYHGEDLERLYSFGIAQGPILGHFTLFAEDAMYENQSLSSTVPAYGLEVEPFKGLLLRGRMDTDGDFRLGFEYNFSQSSYGVVGRYSHEGDSDGRAGYIRLTDEVYQPMKGETISSRSKRRR